jgi:hypothetical protein
MELDRSPLRGRRARRREALREIREELERVRRSEARVAEALGSLRAARHRVEEWCAPSRSKTKPCATSCARKWLRPWTSVPRAGPVRVKGRARSGGSAPPAPSATSPRRSPRKSREAWAGAAISGEEAAGRSLRLVGVAVASLLVVALVGWLGVPALADAPQAPSLTLGGDTTRMVPEGEVGR